MITITGILQLAPVLGNPTWATLHVDPEVIALANGWIDTHVCDLRIKVPDASPEVTARWLQRKREATRGPTYTVQFGAFQLGATLYVKCEVCDAEATNLVDYSNA